METDLGIPSALYAPPVREIIELGKSQIGFMNLFAIPLFQGVTDIMPSLKFCVDELQNNKTKWQERISGEQQKEKDKNEIVDMSKLDGTFSPRTMSLVTPSDVPNQKIGNLTSAVAETGLGTVPEKSTLNPSSSELSSDPLAQYTGAFPSESLAAPSFSETRGSSKLMPSQLQLSSVTDSTPDLSENHSRSENSYSRDDGDVGVQGSTATDAIMGSQPTFAELKESRIQRISDATEGTSAPGSGDWASQATSATTSKLPLSPSTQGTSIMSQESVDQMHIDQVRDQGSIATKTESPTSIEASSVADHTGKGGSVTILETMRGLRKKPSRFRLNFWKRSKLQPAMPTSGVANGRPMSSDRATQ